MRLQAPPFTRAGSPCLAPTTHDPGRPPLGRWQCSGSGTSSHEVRCDWSYFVGHHDCQTSRGAPRIVGEPIDILACQLTTLDTAGYLAVDNAENLPYTFSRFGQKTWGHSWVPFQV